MNIELKPIAQKKLDQMAATVHGVLVKNEAGAWAAVSDAGRVMWLDGFEGRADETRAAVIPSEHGKNRYGLDMAYFRELFNRELNRPLVDFRPDELARVLVRAARTADAAVLQEPEFQAARAQSGQGAECADAERYRWLRDNGHLNAWWSVEGPEDRCANIDSDIDTAMSEHPQSAQQGSVPHWKELEALADDYVEGYEFRGDEGDYQPTERERFLIEDCVAGLMDEIHQMLKLAAPQPEGDGWIKCSERLPKLGQRVQLFSQGVIQHMMPLFDDSDEGLFWDFEVHDYNPPVDMSRDQWRPLPQPPQEGEGDE